MLQNNIMQMKIENLQTLLINLPERTERLERSLEELKSFSIEDVKIIPGVREKHSLNGIANAHLNCIRLAKENKWKAVIICEDDVRFQSKQSREYADLAIANAPEDWDILLGGIYFTKGLTKENDYWNKPDDFCALHFYIVNEKVYDKLLEFDYSTHIDRWIGKNKEIKYYVCNKFFSIQYNGWSDNVRDEMDYSDLLKKFIVLD